MGKSAYHINTAHFILNQIIYQFRTIRVCALNIHRIYRRPLVQERLYHTFARRVIANRTRMPGVRRLYHPWDFSASRVRSVFADVEIPERISVRVPDNPVWRCPLRLLLVYPVHQVQRLSERVREFPRLKHQLRELPNLLLIHSKHQT